MAIEFIGSIHLGHSLVLRNVLDLTRAEDPLRVAENLSLANGTGAGQANALWHDQRALAASGFEVLDLASASNPLVDAFGRAVQFTTVKFLHVFNRSAAAVLTIAPNATAGWNVAFAGAIRVDPGGFINLYSPTAAGWLVTAGTLDQIRITETAAQALTYDIAIVGEQ